MKYGNRLVCQRQYYGINIWYFH